MNCGNDGLYQERGTVGGRMGAGAGAGAGIVIFGIGASSAGEGPS